jgi:hypothetical protein
MQPDNREEQLRSESTDCTAKPSAGVLPNQAHPMLPGARQQVPNIKTQQGTRSIAAAYLTEGQFTEAFADLTQAIRLIPEHAEADSGRSLALAQLGQSDEAAADRERATPFSSQIGLRMLAVPALAEGYLVVGVAGHGAITIVAQYPRTLEGQRLARHHAEAEAADPGLDSLVLQDWSVSGEPFDVVVYQHQSLLVEVHRVRATVAHPDGP